MILCDYKLTPETPTIIAAGLRHVLEYRSAQHVSIMITVNQDVGVIHSGLHQRYFVDQRVLLDRLRAYWKPHKKTMLW